MKNLDEFKLHLAVFEGRGKVGKPGLMYLDHKGIPTVGVGFNLHRKDADDCLKYCGVDEHKLKDIKNGTLALTETQMMSLLEITVAEAEQTVRNKIGSQIFETLHEKQQWALVSLAFNSPALIGQHLKEYSSAGTTSEHQEKAYLEILLNSNRTHHEGVQKRREVEAAWYLEGLNSLRQENHLQPLAEHALAHQSKNNHSASKKTADVDNNHHHAKHHNWDAVAKGRDAKHEHSTIDNIIEKLDKTLETIKEAINHASHEQHKEKQPIENHNNNERSYSHRPAP